MPEAHENVTRLLGLWREGDREALQKLISVVEGTLRRIAGRYFLNERNNHTLQPTELVGELYLRLVGSRPVEVENRLQFFRLSARIMRNILVDHARRKSAGKRGGEITRVPMQEALAFSANVSDTLIVLDELLNELQELSPRQYEVFEVAYFGGLNQQEIARALDISVSTVKRDLRVARAWIRQQLQNRQ